MPDNLTPEQRSYCMSRVKNRDTNLEVLVRSALRQAGRRFTTNDRQLPGSPDVVFRRDRVAVFIHGDFWHGWRFPAWRHAVSPFWQEKIQKNRDRDRRNVTRLKRRGWCVIRLWQHEIESDLAKCVARVITKLRTRPRNKAVRPPTIHNSLAAQALRTMHRRRRDRRRAKKQRVC